MLYILIGSENDKIFLAAGLDYLTQQKVKHEVVVVSCHREPENVPAKIEMIRKSGARAVIAGAATATGLPGVIAGYLRKEKVVVLGVRFSNKPTAGMIEDASFSFSAMPSGVPMTYCGFNEKGFTNACQLAWRIL